MAQADRWLRRLNAYVVSSHPNEKGEWRAYCPLHEHPDTSGTPSATINFEKGLYHCNASCGGGTIRELIEMLDREDKEASDTGIASYNPFGDDDSDDNVVDIGDARARKTGEKRAPLSEALVRGWHKALMASKAPLTSFKKKRGLTDETLVKYEVGYEIRTERYTMPVRDADGRLVNVRRYKPDADVSQKVWNLTGHGSPPRLYPLSALEGADEVLVVEGELDALICNQNGFAAVSGTGGAQRWSAEWSRLFKGKHVYICFDNDKDGRVGGKKVQRSLAPHAASVTVMKPLLDKEKSDVTDWFLAGGTPDQLRDLMAASRASADADAPETTTATAVPVQVIGSMDSRTNGKPLSMAVTIMGKRNPTYSVPAKAELSCTMDAGPKCKVCPMAQEWEGEHVAEIERSDVSTLARFIDASEDRTVDLLRKHVGAVKCNRFTARVEEAHTVEEIFVSSSVDRRSHDGHDYTQRRVYNVGQHDTPTNTTANVIGTTWPSPKDRRNEFFAWDLAEATTSIDTFKVTPELVERLKVFQPSDDQKPIEKCREIAVDLSHNVTKIIGRERLHMAMDLVWHSILNFPLDGKIISRGWLEFIVVGDTRTGKSETAIRLADHYGVGHVIGCEGATFAGLVGAVKQVGDAWTVTWGEITINDRRLCVLDEASGLSQDIISNLSDIRSRGIAQLTKVESQETRARTRLVWISNPRKSKFVDEKKIDGIDVLEDLIGNPEDIARFDFAMSVRSEDVAGDLINSPEREHVDHVYTSDLCHELIVWAWSRKPDQVVWKPEAYEAVYKAAEWLGKRYVERPPLIQRTNVREKVARLAVAMAARTFSTDDSGESVVVLYDHVRDAAEFLDSIYAYDNFGYKRLSDRIKRNRKIAARERNRIRKWLKENPRLLEFLLDRRGSFRAQDLEEMAYMQRDEVGHVLSTLSDAKMVSKEKSQIIIEPELHRLLKEMEHK